MMEEGERIYLKVPSGTASDSHSERDVQHWYREGWLEDNTRVKIVRKGEQWTGSVDELRKQFGHCVPFGPIVRSDMELLTPIQQNISHLRSSFGELKNKDDIANSKYSRSLAQIESLQRRLQGFEDILKSTASSNNEGASTSKVTVVDRVPSSSMPSESPSTSTPSSVLWMTLPEKLPLVEVDRNDVGELAHPESALELSDLYRSFVHCRQIVELNKKYNKWKFCPCCPTIISATAVDMFIPHVLSEIHLARFTGNGGRVTKRAVEKIRSILLYYINDLEPSNSAASFVITVPKLYPLIDIDPSLEQETSVSKGAVAKLRTLLKLIPSSKYTEMESAFGDLMKYDACPVCYDVTTMRRNHRDFISHLASETHYEKFTAKGGRATASCVRFYANFLTAFMGNFEVVMKKE